MAVKRNFYLNNDLVEPPENAAETTIKLSYTQEAILEAQKKISVTSYKFVRENADIILNHFNSGKIFEGLPFRYELERGGVKELIFDGYVDLVDNPQLSCEGCEVQVKQRGNVDWLNDVVDSVSFDYLASVEGGSRITPSQYYYQPYIISTIPNYRDSFLALLTASVSIYQFAEQIRALKEIISEGNLWYWSTIIKLVLRIIYIITLVASIIKLIKDMISFLIQPVKYHACMKAKDLLVAGCDYFGFSFSSTIFAVGAVYENLMIMPEKYQAPSFTSLNIDTGFNAATYLGFPGLNTPMSISGFTSPADGNGYPKTTFGDFLREMKKMFRAKIVIIDKILHFIPEHEHLIAPSYRIPDLYQPLFTTNANELKSNYVISFQTDLGDKNTIQEYKGTSFQVITTQVNPPSDVHLNLLKELEQVNINYGLAKTKRSLTDVEKIARDFLVTFDAVNIAMTAIYNTVAGIVNALKRLVKDIVDGLKIIGIKIHYSYKPTPTYPYFSLASKLIDSRIGMMKIETDYVNVPKVFLGLPAKDASDNKIHPNNDALVCASYLWDHFHGPSVSFLPSTSWRLPSNIRPTGNQFIIKEYDKVSFSFPEYEQIKENNAFYTPTNKIGLIETADWNDYNEVAKMRVRTPQLYTNKLQEIYIEPDGQ